MYGRVLVYSPGRMAGKGGKLCAGIETATSSPKPKPNQKHRPVGGVIGPLYVFEHDAHTAAYQLVHFIRLPF